QSAQGSTKPQLTIVFETGTTTPPASLALSGPLTQPEGNSGSTTFAFTVTRSGDTTQPASASWAVAGSGTNPASANDFAGATLPAGTVSFAPGENSQTIAVQVAGDTTVEPNETFTLTLSNPTGATIANASTTATITNDDVASTPNRVTVTFQQGVGGYAGTVDTNLRGADPTTSYAVAKQLFTDTETGGAP
ncbi:Calx-beta domain-containing protein, partial [Falsiroseomonas oryziterrae]|uniref:Calx-beta domain-containing protein n=1 Tax=Falsiroseomonas oryziterrae TaxID=2911368 RepID=UPI003559168B